METDIGYLLNKAARQLRLKLAEALTETGLTPQQAAVLIALARSAEGRLTPSAISAAIDTDQASASGLLDRLTREGWLVAEPNPRDGRSRLMRLSVKATVAIPDVLGAAERVSADALSCLSAQEASTLQALLAKVCSSNTTAIGKDGRK